MPVIPVYNQPSIERPKQLNAPGLSLNAPVEAFGGGDAAAITKAGQEAQQLGNEGLKFVEALKEREKAHREKTNRVVAGAAVDTALRRASDYMYHPDTGVIPLTKGAAAANMSKAVYPALDRIVEEGASGLDPEQADLYRAGVADKIIALRTDAARHEVQETKAAEDSNDKARADFYLKEAGRLAANKNYAEAEKSVELSLGHTASIYRRNGILDEDGIKDVEATTWSAFTLSAVKGIADTDPAQAEKVLAEAEKRGHITGTDLDEARDTVRKAVEDKRVIDDSQNAMLAFSADPKYKHTYDEEEEKAFLAEYFKNPPKDATEARIQKEVETRVKASFLDGRQARTAGYTKMNSKTWGMVSSWKASGSLASALAGLEKLKPDYLAYDKGEDYDKIRDALIAHFDRIDNKNKEEKSRALSDKEKDPETVVQFYKAKMKADSLINSGAKMDVATMVAAIEGEYGDKVTITQMSQLGEYIAGQGQLKDLTDDRLSPYFKRFTGKDPSKAKVKWGLYFNYIAAKAGELQPGQKPSDNEIEKWTTDFMTRMITEPGIFWDSEVPVSKAPEALIRTDAARQREADRLVIKSWRPGMPDADIDAFLNSPQAPAVLRQLRAPKAK